MKKKVLYLVLVITIFIMSITTASAAGITVTADSNGGLMPTTTGWTGSGDYISSSEEIDTGETYWCCKNTKPPIVLQQYEVFGKYDNLSTASIGDQINSYCIGTTVSNTTSQHDGEDCEYDSINSVVYFKNVLRTNTHHGDYTSAIISADVYTVSDDDQSVTATKAVETGDTYGTLPTPTKDDLTFAGWYTSPTGGTKVTSETEVTETENHTIYAHWGSDTPEPTTYTVNVSILNGTVSPASKTVEEGEDAAFTLIPSEGVNTSVAPTVVCTNNQTGSISNNTLTVSNVSNNSVCTVTYTLEEAQSQIALSVEQIVSEKQIELSWEVPDEIEQMGFELYRSTTQEEQEDLEWPEYIMVEDLTSEPNARSYTVEGLTGNTEYTFYIKALLVEGGTTESNRLNVTTPNLNTNLNGSVTNEGVAVLEWNTSPLVSEYKVYRNPSSDEQSAKPIYVGSTTEGYMEIEGLNEGEEYRFYLEAVIDENTSYSYTVDLTINSGESSYAYVLEGRVISATSVQLDWISETIDPSTVQEYKIFRSITEYDEDNGKAYLLAGTTTDSSYMVENLHKNTEYTFYIEAVIDEENNQYEESNTVTLTTPNISINPVASIVKATSVKITWTANDGVQNYKVFRSLAPNEEGSKPVLAGETTSNTLTVTNLTPNTDYTFYIEAIVSEIEEYEETLDVKTAQIVTLTDNNTTITGLENKTYTGSAITQDITLKYNDETLTEGTDYTVTYNNNTNVGTATMTITGQGDYDGTINKTFTISPKDISDFTVTGIVNKTYTGEILTQNITVSKDNVTLTSNDYTVTYNNNINAGTAEMTIAGQGNYTGTINKTFTISPADISDFDVTGIVNKTYTGSPITQNITVSKNEVVLTEDDYQITYDKNTNAGTAEMTITGQGNYTGTIEKTFTISPADMSEFDVTGIVDKTYTGSAITQTITVSQGTVTLTTEDYTVTYNNNINVGTAEMTITGQGNYTGTINKTFTINPKDISDFDVTGIVNKTYNGQGQTQNVTVSQGTVTLTSNDYTVAYLENVNAGEATVVITGQGNYTGTINKTFTINPADMSNFDVTGVVNKTYNGQTQTQTITVSKDEVTLTSDDYTVTYTNNINAGTAEMSVEGKGNYTGTIEKTFTISPADMSDFDVTGIVDKTYTGSAITQTMTISKDDMTLTTDDYTVTYSKNTNAGTAEITITGKGNYTGTIEKTFTINKLNLGEAFEFNNVIDDQKFIEIVYNDVVLELYTNYTVDYDVTTTGVHVTITGMGNYTGTLEGDIRVARPQATVKLTSYNSINLSWKSVPNADGYYVYYKPYGGDYTLLKTTARLTVTKAALLQGKKYYFKITPYVIIDGQPIETNSYAIVNTYTLKKMYAPTITKYSSTKVKVKWTKISGASGYQISRSTSKTGTYTVVKTVNSSYSSTTLKTTKNRRYYYKVRAYKIVDGRKIYGLWSGYRSYILK